MALAIPLGPRQRTALRYAAIGLATLLTFVFVLQATFPYDRVRDRIVENLSANYDVTIGDVQRGIFPGSVTFKSVKLASRPTKAGDTPTAMFFDRVDVHVGLLAVITRSISIDFDVKMGPGRIAGNVRLPKFGEGGFAVDVDATNLVGRDLPFVSLGMPPIIGKLDAHAALTVPNTKTKAGRVLRDWTQASGTVAFACPSGCNLGDGKTKIKPLLKNKSSQSMVGDGLDFGKLTLDSLAIEGKFTPAQGRADEHSSAYKPGKFEITKFELKSKDGEAHLDFAMTLAQELADSTANGCVRFNVNESLTKTPEGANAFAMLTTTGAERRADGLFHIKLTNRLKDLKRLNQDCGPNDKDEAPVVKPPPHGPGVGNLHPTGRAKPPEPVKPAEPPKPADLKPADATEPKPAEPRPAEPKPAEPRPAEPPKPEEPPGAPPANEPPGENGSAPTEGQPANEPPAPQIQ